MSERRRLLEQWNTYMAAVFPDGRPDPIQIQETRRAFYAGAQAIMGGILGELTPGSEPEAADLRMMDELQLELQAFCEDVKAGRA